LTGFIGPVYSGVQDKYNSSLYYNGLGFGTGISYARINHDSLDKTKNIHHFLISYQFDSLTHPDSRLGIDAHRTAFQYSFLKKVLESKKIGKVLIGGAFRSMFHSRVKPFGNSAFSYEVVHSIGPKLMLKSIPLTFLPNRIVVDYEIWTPLLTAINRPSFSNTEPDKYLTNGRFNFLGTGLLQSIAWHGKIVPIGVFTQLNSTIKTKYALSQRQYLTLNYHWNFYAFNDKKNHEVKVANHLLSIGYKITF